MVCLQNYKNFTVIKIQYRPNFRIYRAIRTLTLHRFKNLRKRLKRNFFDKNFTSCYFSPYEYSPNNIQAVVVVFRGRGELKIFAAFYLEF